jgi:hypothetical protein
MLAALEVAGGDATGLLREGKAGHLAEGDLRHGVVSWLLNPETASAVTGEVTAGRAARWE